MYSNLNQEERQRLRDTLTQKTTKLVELEAEMMELHSVASNMRSYIDFWQGVLTIADATSASGAETSIFLTANSQVSKRHPSDMLHSKFKGAKLGDIAFLVLAESQATLTTTEMTRLIYDTQLDEEFERARNSLSAELRSGSKGDNPRWVKIGRNAYKALAVSRLYESKPSKIGSKLENLQLIH